ncbi:hypothetical protein PZA11_000903 [Diplocarpon coronariae]
MQILLESKRCPTGTVSSSLELRHGFQGLDEECPLVNQVVTFIQIDLCARDLLQRLEAGSKPLGSLQEEEFGVCGIEDAVVHDARSRFDAWSWARVFFVLDVVRVRSALHAWVCRIPRRKLAVAGEELRLALDKSADVFIVASRHQGFEKCVVRCSECVIDRGIAAIQQIGSYSWDQNIPKNFLHVFRDIMDGIPHGLRSHDNPYSFEEICELRWLCLRRDFRQVHVVHQLDDYMQQEAGV